MNNKQYVNESHKFQINVVMDFKHLTIGNICIEIGADNTMCADFVITIRAVMINLG